MKTLYFLPHHDDEVFVIPKIRVDVENGKSPLFIFFMSSDTRAKESLNFLTGLGIPEKNIILLGNKFHAQDGSLLNYLSKYYEELSLMFNQQIGQLEIVCPAYEGGHQDHDAISLLARALAKKWNAPLVEFFLYHGYGTFGKLYYVGAHFMAKKKQSFKYNFRDYINLFKVPFIYKSQKGALLGLWPFLVFKSIFSKLVLRVIDQNSLGVTKHTQVPLYERWGRTTETQFLTTAKSFQDISPVLKSLS